MMRASVLLAAVLVVCVASDAQARRRHHGYGGGYESGERGSSRSSLDAWRRARDAQGQDQDQNQNQGQPRGQDQDRGQAGTPSPNQNLPNQNLGPGRAQESGNQRGTSDLRGERWRGRGEDRARYYDRRRARNLDQWRRAQESGQASGQPSGQQSGQESGQASDLRRGRDDWRRGRDRGEWARDADRRRSRAREDSPRLGVAAPGAAALARTRSGPFGAAVEKLVRGCAAQGAEFESWPFDVISQSVGADEAQRNALAALRDAAKAAAQRLASDCPQDIPAAPAARLEAVEQGIDAALKAFDVVEPKLQAFYGALNDEQKARLYRDMGMPAAGNPTATTDARAAQAPQAVQDERRERRDYYSSRRHRGRDYAAAREAAAREVTARTPAPRQAAAGTGSGAMCAELAGVLRNWPVREIEQGVQLSAQQRVAFYELVTASLKAADTLGSACGAEAALTPVGRMDAMRKRLSAVRAATAAIRAPLARFYEALDQGQQVRFAGMS
jgi:LTXXQ motif family protein